MPIRDSLSTRSCYFNKTALNWITHSTSSTEGRKESLGWKIIISCMCENTKIFVAIFHVISCGVNCHCDINRSLQLWNLFKRRVEWIYSSLSASKMKSQHQKVKKVFDVVREIKVASVSHRQPNRFNFKMRSAQNHGKWIPACIHVYFPSSNQLVTCTLLILILKLSWLEKHSQIVFPLRETKAAAAVPGDFKICCLQLRNKEIKLNFQKMCMCRVCAILIWQTHNSADAFNFFLIPSSPQKHYQYFMNFFLPTLAVPPMVWIQNQLVGSAVGQKIVLECQSEAYPKSINYWMKNDTIITLGNCVT